MPRAGIQTDGGITKLSDDSDPIPYWLLVRYVRRQYQEQPRAVSYAKDQRYWMPLDANTAWCDAFLKELDQKINHLVSLNGEQQETASRIYLFVRDAVVFNGLRLRGPLKVPPPPNGNPAS